jgi:hypothetical protein
MIRRAFLGATAFLFVIAVGATAAPEAALQQPMAVVLVDKVVAGGPKDFMEVRHLVLKGTNEGIGYVLAKIAAERFQVQPLVAQDRLRNRAQRRYIEKNAPIRSRSQPDVECFPASAH